MSRSRFYERLDHTLSSIVDDGLWKHERAITSPQSGKITVSDGSEVLNFCANNYLGLADSPDLVEAARAGMDRFGYGMASVRFICGTTSEHELLEQDVADYLHTDASITFAACFDANGGVFEPLLGPEDAIVSDSLNHASLIDGIRLCKARRYRFETRNMADLDNQLEEARSEGAESILVVTDGVFSMDGYIADLGAICEIAGKHDALVMVDDCHATGFIGPEGRGTPALHGVEDQVDIITSTFGKALGGAMGGFVAARQPVIDLLRQRARPYLFSNALSPAHVAGARTGIGLARSGDDLRTRLGANAEHFRAAMTAAGFELTGEGHPIIPIMLGDAKVAATMADRLMTLGVYVTAFSYPVVPVGAARIRTQMSAAHNPAQIDQAVAAFVEVGREIGVIGNAS